MFEKVCKSVCNVTIQFRFFFSDIDTQPARTNIVIHQINEAMSFVSESLKINKQKTDEFDVMYLDEKRKHKVEVAIIDGDGSCLFASIIHQLESIQLNSQQHKQLAKELRVEVVNYLRENATKKQLEGFVHAANDNLQESELKQKCGTFLKDLLDDREWGGEETMWAVTRLKRVNIVVFSQNNNNNGCRYYDFHNEYARTICVAYVGGCHYNSVCKVPMKYAVDAIGRSLCRFDPIPAIHIE